MGQRNGKKCRSSDEEFYERIRFDFSSMVLITDIVETASVSELWSALDLNQHSSTVLEKYVTNDRYHRKRRKAMVIFADDTIARRFVSGYHNTCFFNRRLRVYHLEDHAREVFSTQFLVLSPEFQRISGHYIDSTENASISISFSKPPESYSNFSLYHFGQFGRLVSIREYRRANQTDVIVRLKFALFAEAYAAYIAYDGRTVEEIQLTIAMEKNPYFYIMYLEGKNLSISTSVSVKLNSG